MLENNVISDDFDPNEAIRKLSATIEQPDKFAEVFCTAAKTQKNIDTALKELIKDLLQHDHSARAIIKSIIREVDKEDWRHYAKKIGLVGWSIILVLITTVANKVAMVVFS